LGTEFEISYNTLKEFACAGWRNPVVEASIRLAEDNELKPEDIERVDVWAYVDREHLPNYPNPQTGLESKFSAEHAFAVGMVDRAGGIAQFTDERVGDGVLTELRQRVNLGFDPKLEPYQIRVEVKTRKGGELSHFVPRPKGDHLRPLSWDELAAKFTANATDVLTEQETSRVIEMVGSIESLEDAQDLLGLCRGAAPADRPETTDHGTTGAF
jgi:2-methylcitrate dehydratase PrpD